MQIQCSATTGFKRRASVGIKPEPNLHNGAFLAISCTCASLEHQLLSTATKIHLQVVATPGKRRARTTGGKTTTMNVSRVSSTASDLNNNWMLHHAPANAVPSTRAMRIVVQSFDQLRVHCSHRRSAVVTVYARSQQPEARAEVAFSIGPRCHRVRWFPAKRHVVVQASFRRGTCRPRVASVRQHTYCPESMISVLVVIILMTAVVVRP